MRLPLSALIMGLALLALATPSLATVPEVRIKVVDFEGFKKELEAQDDTVRIINFWATWCPPCRAEIPDFVEVYNDLKDKGLVVVGITLDDAPEKIRAVMVDKKITYPVVVADQAALSRYGGINAVPTTFIVDRKGNLVSRQVGAMDKKMLEELVKKLL